MASWLAWASLRKVKKLRQRRKRDRARSLKSRQALEVCWGSGSKLSRKAWVDGRFLCRRPRSATLVSMIRRNHRMRRRWLHKLSLISMVCAKWVISINLRMRMRDRRGRVCPNRLLSHCRIIMAVVRHRMRTLITKILKRHPHSTHLRSSGTTYFNWACKRAWIFRMMKKRLIVLSSAR